MQLLHQLLKMIEFETLASFPGIAFDDKII